MKDQYFGDVNDYRKYGLLRLLSGQGRIATAVCWALTPSDARSDGSRIEYLDRPDEWQRFDPHVFEFLRRTVLERRVRKVKLIEQEGILPNFRFFGEVLPDDAPSRDEYFDRFFQFAKGAAIVFFDPDNGLSVQSVKRGDKQSSKYVYESEIERAYTAGHSVLIYQHFPRRPREQFTRRLVRRLSELPGVRYVLAYRTTTVVFVLLPQTCHEKALLANSDDVARHWGEAIHVEKYDWSSPGSPKPASMGSLRCSARFQRSKTGFAA